MSVTLAITLYFSNTHFHLVQTTLDFSCDIDLSAVQVIMASTHKPGLSLPLPVLLNTHCAIFNLEKLTTSPFVPIFSFQDVTPTSMVGIPIMSQQQQWKQVTYYNYKAVLELLANYFQIYSSNCSTERFLCGGHQ